jgi:hypothetical protein
MKLYWVSSQAEKDDYQITGQLRTSQNTLEAKQFFKTRKAVNEYLDNAISQDFHPLYVTLLIVDIEKSDFDKLHADEMTLDGFLAVTVYEEHLNSFNNFIEFVTKEDI